MPGPEVGTNIKQVNRIFKKQLIQMLTE